MTIALLPAAGASRRMGRPKLTLPFAGGTLVGSLVASLRGGGVSTVLLVTAPEDEDLQAWGREAGVAMAVNPAPERGMLSTILEGIAALGGARALAQRGEILLVSPADLPAVRPETIAEVIRRATETGASLALPVYHGKWGHPLAIAPALIPEIETLNPAVGLRQLRERHRAELLEIEVEDAGVVLDVDTPADYEKLNRRT
jgi:molybdenum cofactor cytidylyltransferase